jgi:hypothetical protein
MIERDPELGAALREATGDEAQNVNWSRLRSAISVGATTELARRRQRRWARTFVMPATIAAGFALFVLVARAPAPSLAPSFQRGAADQISIEELLDADVSDGQFRALLAGAGEVNDLLAIAAGEVQ